ncbi:MAG: NAD-dependent DNA ligase LigA [Candidatus Shikimatogenerans sp. JK-2022]|nr:NAD-dependent DNA ligase LigA [Candidatus Shikimatogenerans bostrichidophilus]
MKKKIKKKIYKLNKFINYHNYRYNILNKPKITNYEYDKKLEKLIKLEKKYKIKIKKKKYNIFKKKKFEITEHYFKMYSINNVYNKKDFLLWKKKIDKKINKKKGKRKIEYICELKYDGIALSLIYKYGKLKKAITRGDGKKGYIVLKNILYIKDFPLNIKKIKNIKYFNIQGEIVYSKENFKKINKKRGEKGYKFFANPRNAANGIIHNSKKKIYYKKKLEFLPYSIYTNDENFNKKIKNQFETINFLKKYFLIFQKKSYKLCKNSKEIIKFIKFWEKNIKKSKYPIDGIVIKINKFKLQNKIKNNNIFYKWCIAYKFKNKEYITKLKKIKFTVGKSGIIVPIIIFKSIIINGSKIKKATLHNTNILKNFKLSIKDKILIKKSGNIIPKLIGNLNYKKPKNYMLINSPIYCPSCKELLYKKKNKMFCLNIKKCKMQNIEKIKHFISKKAMNIKINKNLIEKLYNFKKIKNFYDFYKLKIKDLLLLKNITYKEANRIILEIEKSKKKKFFNVLYSLSIPKIGYFISKKIEKKYKNFKNFIKKIKNNNFKIFNLGFKTIKNIKNFFKEKKNIKIIKNFKKIGFNI